MLKLLHSIKYPFPVLNHLNQHRFTTNSQSIHKKLLNANSERAIAQLVRQQGMKMSKQEVVHSMKLFHETWEKQKRRQPKGLLLKYCQSVESLLPKSLLLSKLQVEGLRDMLYSLREQNIKQKLLPNITSIFQTNFKNLYLRGQIRCLSGVESIQHCCRYYALFAAEVGQANSRVANNFANQIHGSILKLSDGEIVLLDEGILCEVLQVIANKYEISLQQKMLYHLILGVLEKKQGNLKLQSKFKIYFSTNCNVYCEKKRNRNTIINSLMNIDQIDFPTMMYFLESCPNYNEDHFKKMYVEFINSLMEKQLVDKLNEFSQLIIPLQLLLGAAKNSSTLSILSKQNIAKLINILKKFIRVSSNDSQINELGDILLRLQKGDFINQEIVNEIYPQIAKVQKLKQNISIIYLLALHGLYRLQFLKSVISIKPKNPLQVEWKQQKIYQLMKIYVISSYIKNINLLQKQESNNINQRQLNQLLSMKNGMVKVQLFFYDLEKIQSFQTFFLSIESQFALVQQFHLEFQHLYFNKLMTKIKQGNQIVRFLLYCIVSCQEQQLNDVCQYFKVLIQITILNKILLSFEKTMAKISKQVAYNFLLVISNFMKEYQNSSLKDNHLLLMVLSNYELVRTISQERIGIVYKILDLLVFGKYKDEVGASRVEQFLLSFMKREYDQINYSLEKTILVKKIITGQKIKNIKNAALLNRMISEGLELNLVQKNSCELIRVTSFEMDKIFHRELFDVIMHEFYPETQITIDKNIVELYPEIILRHSSILVEELKQLQSCLVNGIGKMSSLNQLFRCIILYSLPIFPSDYHLTFLSMVLKRILLIVESSFRYTMIPAALKSLHKIINNKSYGIISNDEQAQISNAKQQLLTLIKNLLEKVVGFICKNSNEVQLYNYEGHINIVELCNKMNMVNVRYVTLVLDRTRENNLGYESYMKLFMMVSERCLILNKEYSKLIEIKMSAVQANNQYIYQLVGICRLVFASYIYLKKVLLSVRYIDLLIKRYIEKCHQIVHDDAKQLPLNNNIVRFCEQTTSFRALKSAVINDKNNKYKVYQIINIDTNSKLIQVKIRNVKKIYGIINQRSRKIPAILLYGLTEVVAGAYNAQTRNIFICNEYHADKFFLREHCNKEEVLAKFEEMCRKEKKYQEIA